MVEFKTYNLLKEFETNTYLIWDQETFDAIIIDPSAPGEAVVEEIKRNNLKVNSIINTHGHYDHIGGNTYFKKLYNCPIGVHRDDAIMLVNYHLNLSIVAGEQYVSPKPFLLFDDELVLTLGNTKMSILNTPGHTKGSIIIYVEPYLFTGDTIFQNSIGRTDLPFGSFKEIKESIHYKVFSFPDDTIILPGHGHATTIKIEKEENPYI